jgi:hypothetical protein
MFEISFFDLLIILNSLNIFRCEKIGFQSIYNWRRFSHKIVREIYRLFSRAMCPHWRTNINFDLKYALKSQENLKVRYRKIYFDLLFSIEHYINSIYKYQFLIINH